MSRQPHGALPARPVGSAAELASRIIEGGDQDIAFVVRLVGDSQDALLRHFLGFVEAELAQRSVLYGDHPLLRPFIETHARELADFVQNGIALHHRISLKAFEQTSGDPLRLLRVDLWDSLRQHIEHAERHFVSSPNGLAYVVAEVEAFRAGTVRHA